MESAGRRQLARHRTVSTSESSWWLDAWRGAAGLRPSAHATQQPPLQNRSQSSAPGALDSLDASDLAACGTFRGAAAPPGSEHSAATASTAAASASARPSIDSRSSFAESAGTDLSRGQRSAASGAASVSAAPSLAGGALEDARSHDGKQAPWLPEGGLPDWPDAQLRWELLLAATHALPPPIFFAPLSSAVCFVHHPLVRALLCTTRAPAAGAERSGAQASARGDARAAAYSPYPRTLAALASTISSAMSRRGFSGRRSALQPSSHAAFDGSNGSAGSSLAPFPGAARMSSLSGGMRSSSVAYGRSAGLPPVPSLDTVLRRSIRAGACVP